MSSVAFPNLQWGRIVAIGEKIFGGSRGENVPELFFPKRKGGAWNKLTESERRGKEKKRKNEGR